MRDAQQGPYVTEAAEAAEAGSPTAGKKSRESRSGLGLRPHFAALATAPRQPVPPEPDPQSGVMGADRFQDIGANATAAGGAGGNAPLSQFPAVDARSVFATN
jgi:hypothetical protein